MINIRLYRKIALYRLLTNILFQFQIKDEIKAARIEATKAYNFVR